MAYGTIQTNREREQRDTLFTKAKELAYQMQVNISSVECDNQNDVVRLQSALKLRGLRGESQKLKNGKYCVWAKEVRPVRQSTNGVPRKKDTSRDTQRATN